MKTNGMQTERVAIASLKPDRKNAREHDEDSIKALKVSLEKFGQQKPVVVTKGNRIVTGNGLYEAAKALGWEEIEVVRTSLKGQALKAYAIADNRTAELSEWELPNLADALREVGEFQDSLGFSDGDLENLLSAEFPVVDDGASVEDHGRSAGGKDVDTGAGRMVYVSSEQLAHLTRALDKARLAEKKETLGALMAKLAVKYADEGGTGDDR